MLSLYLTEDNRAQVKTKTFFSRINTPDTENFFVSNTQIATECKDKLYQVQVDTCQCVIYNYGFEA
jgi:hypothetical protein